MEHPSRFLQAKRLFTAASVLVFLGTVYYLREHSPSPVALIYIGIGLFGMVFLGILGIAISVRIQFWLCQRWLADRLTKRGQ